LAGLPLSNLNIQGQVLKIQGVFRDKSSRFREFSRASSKWNYVERIWEPKLVITSFSGSSRT